MYVAGTPSFYRRRRYTHTTRGTLALRCARVSAALCAFSIATCSVARRASATRPRISDAQCAAWAAHPRRREAAPSWRASRAVLARSARAWFESTRASSACSAQRRCSVAARYSAAPRAWWSCLSRATPCRPSSSCARDALPSSWLASKQRKRWNSPRSQPSRWPPARSRTAPPPLQRADRGAAAARAGISAPVQHACGLARPGCRTGMGCGVQSLPA